MEFRIQPRSRLTAWLTLLAVLALLAAIGIAVTVVAVGVFLFLLPALLIVAVVYYFYLRLRFGGARKPPKQPDIIDGEYRVVDKSEPRS